MYGLLTENYVLNANVLVFMLIHTELFSNVSGLGLGLEKKLDLGLVLGLTLSGLGLSLGLMPSCMASLTSL